MRSRNLGSEMQARDAMWLTLTDAERLALREKYRAAGWKLCPHDTCMAWSCETR